MADTEKKVNIQAPQLKLQPVSVTRKMAASLPGLRELAESKGLKIHHLGAGYPHPEVTDPRSFIAHKDAYFQHIEALEGLNDDAITPEHLRETYSYTDTLGPKSVRETFAAVYGADWDVTLDPNRLIPTVGATGGINLICSMFERSGQPVAYISDAPTYAGFTARVGLCQHACIYSVEMDAEGAIPEQMAAQIDAARADGYFVPFYYTVPDGHNPAGFSFTQSRREALMAVARDKGILIVEDAPYIYINYAASGERAQPFLTIDPQQTIHLFTGSKIGFPGPRIGFLYSEAVMEVAAGRKVDLSTMALTEASSDVLFQNPAALRGFEAMLHDDNFERLPSMWPLAREKLRVYEENREIMLDILAERLGPHGDKFSWTQPGGGFFTVFTFLDEAISTDDDFVSELVANYGVVVIPMYDFYPQDAKQRNPRAGLNQLRLSFCFSESIGEQRRQDMRDAVNAFCDAVLTTV
ncbi:MAG: pyridoxal phosphate-dependent aminotransferase [Pseudomonadales bacterium]